MFIKLRVHLKINFKNRKKNQITFFILYNFQNFIFIFQSELEKNYIQILFLEEKFLKNFFFRKKYELFL